MKMFVLLIKISLRFILDGPGDKLLPDEFTKTRLYVSPGFNELTHWPLGDLNEILDK